MEECSAFSGVLVYTYDQWLCEGINIIFTLHNLRLMIIAVNPLHDPISLQLTPTSLYYSYH